MKILALDKPGTAKMEEIVPLLKQETAHLWACYASGVVREMYYRADRMGVVLVLECEGLEAARKHLGEFPLVKAGLVDFELVPVGPFIGLQNLFAGPEQPAH